jgi:acetylornithine deacetylase/succinyl-diaminopimelate desuccinylase-like protein
MDINLTKQFIDNIFDKSAIPELEKYIKIEAKSASFDEQWEKNGFLNQACYLVKDWCLSLSIDGLSAEVISPEGRSPLLLIEIEATSNKTETTLIYGHLDKQPEFSGWDDNKGPFEPVIENNKLYGRGGADDGYAAFSALCAIKALKKQNLKHNKFVILIESGEESGSPDLPYYINKYDEQIGDVDLIICLDSGCGDYERFWVTNSLRGTIACNLEVKILKQGIHSGNSGIAASSFRILRNLLDRIEDSNTGKITLKELHPQIPEKTMEMIQKSVDTLGDNIISAIPFVNGARPVCEDHLALILNNTWKPALSYIGIDGMPAFKHAGSVLRPSTSISLSLRLPPSTDPERAMSLLKETLEKDPPYNSEITLNPIGSANGWEMPEISDRIFNGINEASKAFFNNDACFIGEGGSIPFMNMLLNHFPKAQFIVTGVLGPNANAHGPNEFLHIPYVKQLTCSLAYILATQD